PSSVVPVSGLPDSIATEPGRALRTLRRRRGGWDGFDDVASGRAHPLVELELPVVAREVAAGDELADVRLDPLAARHPHDQLRVRASRQRRVHRRGEGAAEARVDIGDAEPDLAIAERLHRARTAHAERLDDAPAQL